MDRRSRAVMPLTILVVFALLLPAGALAKGGPPDGHGPGGGEETAGNNLSFPVIAADGFAITAIGAPSFQVPYNGSYDGLTTAEITALVADGPWYPQQTEGNVWQADYALASEGTPVAVTKIDWGDSIESNYPKVGSPLRLELSLYQDLDPESPMTAYTMAVLENPSSPDELQGTNNTTYESERATIVSGEPKLVVQYLGASVPTTMDWSGTAWAGEYEVVPVSFATELNVAGKYIFGGSEGGWKPDKSGYYRITFYVPDTSDVSLAGAVIWNASGTEGTAAYPVVDGSLGLTYVDVLVKTKGGGGRR